MCRVRVEVGVMAVVCDRDGSRFESRRGSHTLKLESAPSTRDGELVSPSSSDAESVSGFGFRF